MSQPTTASTPPPICPPSQASTEEQVIDEIPHVQGVQPLDDGAMVSGWQGCGFNANGQVNGKPMKDGTGIQELSKLPKMSRYSEVLLARWAYTVVFLERHMETFIFGIHEEKPATCWIDNAAQQASGSYIHPSALIGTDLQLLGSIALGQLWRHETGPSPSLRKLTFDKNNSILSGSTYTPLGKFKLGHAATLHTGRTALLATNEGTHTLHESRVIEAADFETLVAWYEDCQTHAAAIKIRVFHTRLVGIVAGATAFVAWNEGGHIYTWGDQRHIRELGRIPSALAPADAPAILPYLHGIRISKIVAQGSTYVALAKDGGALYIWGGNPMIDTISDENGKFYLQDIAQSVDESHSDNGIKKDEDNEDHGRDYDEDDDGDDIVKLIPFEREVRDVAIGLAHMVVITKDNVLYAIGDNRYHQLPYTTWKKDPGIIRQWRDCGTNASKVVCGPLTTFFNR